jgi:hypothetical protein
MNLNAHGFFEIEQYNDIVLIRFIGSMNVELYLEYNKEISAIGRMYNGRKWAEVLDYREWELAPPEVFEKALELEKNPEKQRFRCSDQVIIATSKIIEQISIQNNKNPVYVKSDFVKNEEEAFTILNGKGYLGEIPLLHRR